MKRRDLIRHLEHHGCELLREGGNHSIYVNRRAGRTSSVPRHNEINNECTTASGGVVAMSPLTLHASSKAVEEPPRRILHIAYASTISLAPGIELVVA